jgi:DNA-binding transcriptional LysR family regulator
MGSTPQQTLKLGYTIGAGLEIVPKLLRTYRERQPSAAIETEEFDFTDPSAGLRDNLVNAAVVRPPLGLAGLVSVELATERLVACLPDNHPLAARDSLGVADVLPEPIIAAPASPGPWRDYWLLTDYRSGPAPVVAEAPTLDAETHLVSTGAGLSITSEAVGQWYKRPGVTFVPILDLPPCTVALAWWPQDTGLVAGLAAVANEVRATIAEQCPGGSGDGNAMLLSGLHAARGDCPGLRVYVDFVPGGTDRLVGSGAREDRPFEGAG